MSLEQALTAATAAIQELISVLRETSVDAAPAKRGRKAAAAEASSSAPAPAPSPTPAPASAPQPAPQVAPAGQLNMNAVATKFLALAETKGRDVALGILNKYGLSRLAEAKPEQLAAILADVEQATNPAAAAAAAATSSLI